MQVGHEMVGGAMVISPRGEIDISTIGLLNDELWIAANAPAQQPVIIDLQGVSFMDSTGLRALLDAADRARDRQQPFVVFRVPLAVARVLQVTRLEDRFPEIKDLEPGTLASLTAGA